MLVRRPWKTAIAVGLISWIPIGFIGCSSSDEQQEEEFEASEDTGDEDLGVDEELEEPVEEEVVELPSEPLESTGSVGSTGGVVRYVRSSSLTIHAQPDSSAPSIGTLRRGDHVFINVEGDWGQLAQGGYVPMSQLSKKALSRARNKANWRP